MSATTHYELLGIPEDADDDTIGKAYRSLIRHYHPDRAGTTGASMSQKLNEAYAVLRDPDTRRLYDRDRVQGPASSTTSAAPEPRPEQAPQPAAPAPRPDMTGTWRRLPLRVRLVPPGSGKYFLAAVAFVAVAGIFAWGFRWYESAVDTDLDFRRDAYISATAWACYMWVFGAPAILLAGRGWLGLITRYAALAIYVVAWVTVPLSLLFGAFYLSSAAWVIPVEGALLAAGYLFGWRWSLYRARATDAQKLERLMFEGVRDGTGPWKVLEHAGGDYWLAEHPENGARFNLKMIMAKVEPGMWVLLNKFGKVLSSVPATATVTWSELKDLFRAR
ncbi:J domain-containing protein [Leifsonia sp. Leaf264]|uniref:J domain-containing protein n=1 Tax=Leifsonia sp. Leaf264 TaxID=1736314 RepID=UPI0006F589A3|nr:J domain-containing protein [Leifsonia sp. Leaf264]KQO98300.1 hypothetical protein ASF30_09580 [Leifsonia sp. Leaf264]